MEMSGATLVYVAIVGIIALMFAGQIVAFGKNVIAWFSPTAASSNAVTTASTVADTASRWAQYAAGRAAVFELRVIDFTAGTLDIHAELDAIEQKMAEAIKHSTLTPVQPDGQG
jgi:hypothetical protein